MKTSHIALLAGGSALAYYFLVHKGSSKGRTVTTHASSRFALPKLTLNTFTGSSAPPAPGPTASQFNNFALPALSSYFPTGDCCSGCSRGQTCCK